MSAPSMKARLTGIRHRDYFDRQAGRVTTMEQLERCGCRQCFDLAWAAIDQHGGSIHHGLPPDRATYYTGIAIVPATGEAELFIQKSYVVPMMETIPCPPR